MSVAAFGDIAVPERGAWRGLLREPLLAAAAGVLMLALVPVTLAALVADGRELYEIDIWIKPLKFELALAIYLLHPRGLCPLAAVGHAGAALVPSLRGGGRLRHRLRDHGDRGRGGSRDGLALQHRDAAQCLASTS